MKNKIRFLMMVSFLAAGSAQATCYFQTCTDSDGGNVPSVAGYTTAKVSCSPPGGPVTISTQVDNDQCQGGQHTEYVCGNQNVPTAITTPCSKCAPNGKACTKKIKNNVSEVAPVNSQL